jgi:uncharacterized repeat protein (TIGR02543 family)
MKIKLVVKFTAVIVIILTTLVLAVSPVKALTDDTGVYNLSFLGMTGTLNLYQGELVSVNWTTWQNTGASRFEIPSNLYKGIYTYQITDIAADAFAGCTASSIYLGSFLNDVDGAYTFAGSTNLTSIEFQDGFHAILENMFQGCTSLTSITFPSGTFYIRSSAFQGCTSLTSVTFPSGIDSIEDSAFSGCTSLTKVIFTGGKPTMDSDPFSNTSSNIKLYYPVSKSSSWSSYTAHTTQAYCYVTYDRNYSGGGQSKAMTNVNSGHITAPTNPTRTGYTFGGWYKEAACTNKWNFGSDTVTDDITLYAQWTDTSAPTLSNVTPTILKAGTTISATSSETGTLYLVLKGTSSYTSQAALTAAATKTTSSTTAGSAVTINTTGVAEGTYQIYTVDAAGNVSSASADITIDNTAPIPSLSPADNAANVGITSNLVITFNENVVAGTGNITIKKTSDDSTVETIVVTDTSKVTGSGTTKITINPSKTLDGKTGYYILIATTAFKDTAGNSYAGISSPTAWNFTTADPTAPTVNFIRPGDGDKLNISTGSTVIAEVICDGDTIVKNSITIQIDGGAPVKPAGFADVTGGYKLYYVITGINYGTANNSHKITISAANSSGTQISESITFTMEPKRKGFGFGRLRFD